MTSSSAAASTLTRPRIAIAIVSAFAAVSAGYYFYQYRALLSDSEDTTASSLHRSNAVRRPHRPALQQQDDSSESESPQGDENVDTTAQAPVSPALLPDPDGQNDDDDDLFTEAGPMSRQRTGENIVTLLFRVSEDNARRNAYVHRGCQCNGCGMVPIRGIRYRCANCADFDLCEVCESQGAHNKTHVFYKVRIPAPPFSPRQVQPAWYPGDPDSFIRALPRYLLVKWSLETGFERVELDAYWEQWTFMANTEWREDPDGLCLAMDRKTFERCLVPSGGYRHATPNLIHDRMFAFYDTDKNDLIGFEEFLHGVAYRKRKDKLRRTFEGYDIDGDGYVSRRDFLRMFRAYYVLFKQMHRDILEGLDDHMMTTTEAQQLVNSRAPLSSLFGREGRVPEADHSRPMEGKIFRSNGEVDIHDGKDGVVNEDKQDTLSREDILGRLFARNSNQSLFTESFGSPSSRQPRSPNGDTPYIAGIINPPQNTVDLSSLVNGDRVQLDDIIASIRNDEALSRVVPEDDETDGTSSDEDEQATPENGETSGGDSATLPAVEHDDTPRSLAIPDGSRFTNRIPTESELRARHQAIVANSSRLGSDKRRRVQARRQLHDRWKRRQFYLDEEEGALPPQGWEGEEDVLAHLNGVAESSKSGPQMLSPRSRSSSKVRFAEDADDFDIRSNPSTSSRSVPERWGGMEIPDAERDAGKEILYQITQQAFNELLDEIFKKKEDLAVRCAETKESRDKHRHAYENSPSGDHEKSTELLPTEGASNGHVQSPSLVELLNTSGYTVDPLATIGQCGPAENLDTKSGSEAGDGDESSAVHNPSTPVISSEDASLDGRDPTMPQFRPNAQGGLYNDDEPISQQRRSMAEHLAPDHKEHGRAMGAGGTQDPQLDTQAPDDSESPSESTIEEWKLLDHAENEARERGGWGKLSYEEFEAIYKEHEFQDNSRNRLDYLGSWIDFCIP